MSTGIWSAASGAVAQGFSLDVAANNIANATIPGFRSDQAVFRQELAKAVQQGQTPSLRYALVRSARVDFRAGDLTPTGRPLDVALRSDDTFFVVKTKDGERYTRAGGAHVAADGSLTMPDGTPSLGPDRKILKVPAEAKSVAFSKDGRLVVDGVESPQRLLVVSFKTPAALERDGKVMFRAPPAAGRPVEAVADLEVESLEGSNASAVGGMTSLVTASRQFEMLTKVIEAFSTIDRKAATDVMAKR